MLEKNADKPPLTVNVGSGVSTYTDDIAKRIKDISKKKMQMRFDRNKTIGTVSRTADVGKLLSLGWRPKVTLDEGLRLTYKWLETKVG